MNDKPTVTLEKDQSPSAQLDELRERVAALEAALVVKMGDGALVTTAPSQGVEGT